MKTTVPYISRIRVKNFRSLADVDVTLGPLTVLVGRNSAGKSSFLDVIRFMRDAVGDGFAKAVRKRDKEGRPIWPSLNMEADLVVGLEVKRAEGPVYYEITLSLEDERGEYELGNAPLLKQEVLEVDGERYVVNRGQWVSSATFRGRGFPPGAQGRPTALLQDLVRQGGVIDVALGDAAIELYEFLQHASFYDFDLRSLRRPQDTTWTGELEERGENLGAVLRSLQRSSSRGDFQSVVEVVSRAVEGVQGITVTDVGDYLVIDFRYDAPESGKQVKMKIAHESDGTIRLLAMLVALYQNPPRSLVVLEEPESNLHPGAMHALADAMAEVSARAQVIVTTHSPDLLDAVSAESVLVVEKEDGATKVGQMQTTQREVVQEKLFSLGELMRIQGLEPETKSPSA